jgi:hypothetical protein
LTAETSFYACAPEPLEVQIDEMEFHWVSERGQFQKVIKKTDFATNVAWAQKYALMYSWEGNPESVE